MTDKYRDACAEYAKASAEVRRLGKAIGDAIRECYISQDAVWNKEHPDTWMRIPDAVDHLKLAYAMEREQSDCGYGFQRYFANHDGDVEGYLAEKCPHCYAAHMAIQERKKARQRLGVAKRRIGALGRAALGDA